MNDGTTQIVQLKGHNYFVVDQDVTKGDRRSDGPGLSKFFLAEEGSSTVNNVRQSNRIKKIKEEVLMVNTVCLGENMNEGLVEEAQDATMSILGCDVELVRKKTNQCTRRQFKGDGDVSTPLEGRNSLCREKRHNTTSVVERILCRLRRHTSKGT
jgi:hypothetical protein